MRNIFLVGKTGSGKSTLANVLSKSENYFNESSGSVSETKEIKGKEFEVDGIKYRVIDTIGFKDTSLPLERDRFLGRFKSKINSFSCEGIYQILYVIDKRITADDVIDFKLLSSYLFDKRVFDYTTIVKTNFSDFSNIEKCNEDAEKLVKFIEDEDIGKVISEKRIVYVNNLSDDLREESRKKLLEYLFTVNDRNGERLDDYKIMAPDGIMQRFSLLKNRLGSVLLGLFNKGKSESSEDLYPNDLEELFGLFIAIREGNWINKDLAKVEFDLYRLTMECTNSLSKSKIDKFLEIHGKITKIKLTEVNWRKLIKEHENELKTKEEELEERLNEEQIKKLKNLNKRATTLRVFSGELEASDKFQLQLNISTYVTNIGFLKNLSNCWIY